MQNSLKKYLKTTHINNYTSVSLFENKDYFGVEVVYHNNKKLNKRNQFKKCKYNSDEECRLKAEKCFQKHIATINRIISDAKFQK